jgi:hypothetical protein
MYEHETNNQIITEAGEFGGNVGIDLAMRYAAQMTVDKAEQVIRGRDWGHPKWGNPWFHDVDFSDMPEGFDLAHQFGLISEAQRDAWRAAEAAIDAARAAIHEIENSDPNIVPALDAYAHYRDEEFTDAVEFYAEQLVDAIRRSEGATAGRT